MNYFQKIKEQGYYLIAEIGVNYYDIAEKKGISLLDGAKLMIEEAKKAGADAVKFQTYTAKGLASKYSPSYWDTKEVPLTSQYEFFKLYEKLGEKEYVDLCEFAKQLDIEFLSTPFDFESADYLEPLMNLYKISSSDLTNHPFVEYIAKKNKPIILSVGASTSEEIASTVKLIRENNNKPLTLLHCVLEYPTPYEHANLRRIQALIKEYPDCIIGYSDHTKPDECMDVLKLAFLLGAKVIEKHFTLDKSIKGKNDHFHSMDPDDIRLFKRSLALIESIEGEETLECKSSEAAARMNARRSIVAAIDITKGTKIDRSMLTFKRPGTGIPPYDIESVLGKIALKDIEEDTILQKNMFDGD